MKHIEINATTAPTLRAVHLDACGPGAIEVVLPDGNHVGVSRRPSEPWPETRPRVIEALEKAGWLLAGNPEHRTKRPQLLLVVRGDEVRDEDMGYWHTIEETMNIAAVRDGALVDDYVCDVEGDPRFPAHRYLIAEARYVSSMTSDYRVTLTNNTELFEAKVDEYLEAGDE